MTFSIWSTMSTDEIEISRRTNKMSTLFFRRATKQCFKLRSCRAGIVCHIQKPNRVFLEL